MRARGAQGADIVILVVAANDGVMPQTREAIAHARAARVPIIVALNKIDLPDANPDFTKQQLADAGLVSDEWDGDTIIVPVSAKKNTGIEDLLEAIQIVADNISILANPNGTVMGTVIEASVDKNRGVIATLLVQNGPCAPATPLRSAWLTAKSAPCSITRANPLKAPNPPLRCRYWASTMCRTRAISSRFAPPNAKRAPS
jgi:translation initiation factor IF-2